MIQNKSIFEDQEQQFSEPFDSRFAKYDLNRIQKVTQQKDEEFDYNYKKENLHTVQYSVRSNSKENQIIPNGTKSNEIQNSENDIVLKSYYPHIRLKEQQSDENYEQGFSQNCLSELQQQRTRQQNESYQNQNNISQLKHKSNESSQQKFQYPLTSGNSKFMNSINISPISNHSFHKSDSLSQSEDGNEEGTSEIQQIQLYINKNQMNRNNQNTSIKRQDKSINRNEDISDNLDYAEMVIKSKQPIRSLPSNNPEEYIERKLIVQPAFEEKGQQNKMNRFRKKEKNHLQKNKPQKISLIKLILSNKIIEAKDVNLSNYIPQQTIRLSLDNQKKILFEGELSKYKPGLNFNFISRYICLSLENLKYYKNNVHSKCYQDKPLYVLPLSCIQAVSQISFTVPLLPKEVKRLKQNLQKLYPDNVSKNLVIYYFEIIIDIPSLKSYMQENDSSASNKPRFHLMPQDNFDQYRNGEMNKKIQDLTTWSGRSHEWYECEERLVFCTHDKNILDTWVAVLNWIISLHKKQQSSNCSFNEMLSD